MGVIIAIGAVWMFCELCRKVTKHAIKANKNSDWETYECSECHHKIQFKTK